MPFTSSDEAKAARAKGGGRQKKPHPPTVEEVARDLPTMTSHEAVQRRLEIVCGWGAVGRVPPAFVSAHNNACREWREIEALKIDRDRMRHLEAEVKKLTDALSRRQASPLRRA